LRVEVFDDPVLSDSSGITARFTRRCCTSASASPRLPEARTKPHIADWPQLWPAPMSLCRPAPRFARIGGVVIIVREGCVSAPRR
jgi:hypothetical protein